MGGPRTSVGVCVLEKGSDESSVTAMLDENRTRTGVLPSVLLADANHGTHELVNGHFKERFDIDQVLVRGTTKVISVILLASIALNLLKHASSLCT